MNTTHASDPDQKGHKANIDKLAHHSHKPHDHEYDPDKKPPYITLFLLIAMVLVGIILVIYFRVWI